MKDQPRNLEFDCPEPACVVALRHLLERVDERCQASCATCRLTADLINRHQGFPESTAGVHLIRHTRLRPGRLCSPAVRDRFDAAVDPPVQLVYPLKAAAAHERKRLPSIA